MNNDEIIQKMLIDKHIVLEDEAIEALELARADERAKCEKEKESAINNLQGLRIEQKEKHKKEIEVAHLSGYNKGYDEASAIASENFRKR